MKKMNKKGFTITELVIVIAVIAILAGVMIPTFSGIVKKAQISAEQQNVTSAFKDAYAQALLTDGEIAADEEATSGGYTFKFGANAATCEITAGNDTSKYSYTYNTTNKTWTVTEKTGG